jgi:hypothetical protein
MPSTRKKPRMFVFSGYIETVRGDEEYNWAVICELCESKADHLSLDLFSPPVRGYFSSLVSFSCYWDGGTPTLDAWLSEFEELLGVLTAHSFQLYVEESPPLECSWVISYIYAGGDRPTKQERAQKVRKKWIRYNRTVEYDYFDRRGL